MQGWVDLGGGYNFQHSLPAKHNSNNSYQDNLHKTVQLKTNDIVSSSTQTVHCEQVLH